MITTIFLSSIMLAFSTFMFAQAITYLEVGKPIRKWRMYQTRKLSVLSRRNAKYLKCYAKMKFLNALLSCPSCIGFYIAAIGAILPIWYFNLEWYIVIPIWFTAAGMNCMLCFIKFSFDNNKPLRDDL